MELFLKEPTITDKEEVVKMCIEIAYSNDEYKFGLSKGNPYLFWFFR